MKIAIRWATVFPAFCLEIIGIALASDAIAQQRVPSDFPVPKGAMTGIPKDWAAQKIPRQPETKPFQLEDWAAQKAATPADRNMAGWLAANTCTLNEVEPKELDDVRSTILELLSSDAAARTNFISSEKQVPANCPRAKATFYLRAIARVKASK